MSKKKKISIEEILEFCRDNSQEYVRNKNDGNSYWEIYEYRHDGKFYRYQEHSSYKNFDDEEMTLFSKKIDVYLDGRDKPIFSLMVRADGKELKRSKNSEVLQHIEIYLLSKKLNSQLDEKKSSGGKTKI